MKEEYWEIILSGVGGQGLVACGDILGEAASFSNFNVVMTTAYGVETRGTFVKSDLIISREYIDYPKALRPDIILTLSPVAYRNYAPTAQGNTLIIFDSGTISFIRSRARQLGFPIAATAEELGNIASANILSLGLILGETKLLDLKFLQQAIKNRFGKNPTALEKNLSILTRGFEMAHGKTV